MLEFRVQLAPMACSQDVGKGSVCKIKNQIYRPMVKKNAFKKMLELIISICVIVFQSKAQMVVYNYISCFRCPNSG